MAIEPAPKVLSDAFDHFDIDENGYIDTDKIVKLVQYLNRKPRKLALNALMNEMDIDHDGMFDPDEFRRLMTRIINADGDFEKEKGLNSYLRWEFKRADSQCKGKISAKELVKFVKSKGFMMDDTAKCVLQKEFDWHKTGKIEKEHFVKVFSAIEVNDCFTQALS